MTKRLYSLLDDPLIGVRLDDGTTGGQSLPMIYSHLVADRIVEFTALQPHQQQPWYSFLVQVAAMAIARHGHSAPPSDAETWRSLLLELAKGSDDGWHLVVDDASRPAFLQSPIPEGSIKEAKYKADTPTPDDLDVLITTKTHDIKDRRIQSPDPQHWIFSLLTLQTMEGFLGVGNYGIVRMNGGFGNRPFMGLSPGLTWGARFTRDISVLLAHREEMLDSGQFSANGYALLWLEPWDGGKKSGLPLSKCDPYFLEICRRLRFTIEEGQLLCWRSNTDAQRVDAPDDLNGRTGDPWTPVDKGKAKALTLGGGGFTYEVLQSIWLGDDYALPPTLEFQDDDPEQAYLVASTLVRGQGKTEGWHRRIIPVPGEVRRLFGRSEDGRRELAKRAQTRVQLAAEVQSKVLRGPVFTLVYGGRRPADPDWNKINMWIESFDRAVDACFFENLWDSVQQKLSQDEAAIQWELTLRKLAVSQYRKFRDAIPLPSIHRYRILSNADGQFYSSLNRVLSRTAPDYSDDDTTDEESRDERPALT